jgi:nucleotide-binding universal stress UspA family protein
MTGPEITEGISVIVCGFDGSPSSQAAVDWAGALAACCDAEVIVVSVYDWNPMVGESTNQEMIDQRTEELDTLGTAGLRERGVRHRTIVETGDSRLILLAVCQLHRADLLVVGSRGRSQLAEIMLGSVAHYLTHHAEVPVVVVPDRERFVR